MKHIEKKIKKINQEFSRLDILSSLLREKVRNLLHNLTVLFEGKRIIGKDLKVSYCITERVFLVCRSEKGKILFSLENRNKKSLITLDHLRKAVENLPLALSRISHMIELRRPHSKDVLDVFGKILGGGKRRDK